MVGPIVVVVFPLEARPEIWTLASSPGEERRLVDWLLEGDDRIREVVDRVVALVTERVEGGTT